MRGGSAKVRRTSGAGTICLFRYSRTVSQAIHIGRYLGQERILMTNYAQFDVRMAVRFKRALEKHFDKIEELHFDVPSVHKYSWAYINWLQTEQVLIIPKFGIPEDEQALAQIRLECTGGR